MLVFMDGGNRNGVRGVFESKTLRAEGRLTTNRAQTADEYGILIRNLFTLDGIKCGQISGIIISSVVPPLNAVLEEMALKYFSLTPLFLGPGVRTGMAIQYANPQEVGADRIADSVAAFGNYAGPGVQVGVSTAITHYAGSSARRYL